MVCMRHRLDAWGSDCVPSFVGPWLRSSRGWVLLALVKSMLLALVRSGSVVLARDWELARVRWKRTLLALPGRLPARGQFPEWSAGGRMMDV